MARIRYQFYLLVSQANKTSEKKMKRLQMIQGRQDNFSTESIIPLCSINKCTRSRSSESNISQMNAFLVTNDCLPSICCGNSSFPLKTDFLSRSRVDPIIPKVILTLLTSFVQKSVYNPIKVKETLLLCWTIRQSVHFI